MAKSRLSSLRLPLANLAFAVVLLAAATGLYLLAALKPVQVDVTQNRNNSLDPASIQVLQNMPGPVNLIVFTPEQDVKQGNMYKLVRQFISLFQRYKPDITLIFVDPAKQPDIARQADIRNNGEMVVEYQGRREHLTSLSEQSLSNALLSLAHRQEQLLMYVSGHGEPSLDGQANFDLGEFGSRLTKLGFKIGALNLDLAQDVPDNVSLLVITEPQMNWLPGEMSKLMRYLSKGGNLLWMTAPGSLHGLEPLAQKLGLRLVPGIVIDPDAEQLRAPATWALGTNYPPHAITHNFNLVTAFPYTRPLAWNNSKEWQYSELVEAALHGWVSNAPPAGQVTPKFHKGSDKAGPVTVALAMQRKSANREQRIVVVGSDSFLANTYAGNGGNIDLGVNMVNWLTRQDKLIVIPPHSARDRTILLGKTELAVISIGLAIVLPLLLALVGGWLWWRRRK